MASRAVSKVNADWSKLAAQVASPSRLNKLKSKVDATGAKITNLPESLPKIDWSHYKALASNPKLVEEIEKSYAAIKIDRPKAPASRLQDLKVAQEQDEARLKRFGVIAKSYIESAAVVQTKFENMIPVKDMTMEDWFLTFPMWSVSIENPSIWPHYGRAPGLTKEEAMAFEIPDPRPFSTKTAWKDWEERKKKFYS